MKTNTNVSRALAVCSGIAVTAALWIAATEASANYGCPCAWHKATPSGTHECINWEGQGRQSIAVHNGLSNLWVAGCNFQQQCYDGICEQVPEIWSWSPASQTFVPSNGYAIAIALGGDGTPWVVPEDGSLYNYTGGSWVQKAGAGTAGPQTAQFPSLDVSGSTVWFLGSRNMTNYCYSPNHVFQYPCVSDAFPIQQVGSTGAEEITVDHVTGSVWINSVSAGGEGFGQVYGSVFGWVATPQVFNSAICVMNSVAYGISSSGYLQSSTNFGAWVTMEGTKQIYAIACDSYTGLVWAAGDSDNELYFLQSIF